MTSLRAGSALLTALLLGTAVPAEALSLDEDVCVYACTPWALGTASANAILEDSSQCRQELAIALKDDRTAATVVCEALILETLAGVPVVDAILSVGREGESAPGEEGRCIQWYIDEGDPVQNISEPDFSLENCLAVDLLDFTMG